MYSMYMICILQDSFESVALLKKDIDTDDRCRYGLNRRKYTRLCTCIVFARDAPRWHSAGTVELAHIHQDFKSYRVCWAGWVGRRYKWSRKVVEVVVLVVGKGWRLGGAISLQ